MATSCAQQQTVAERFRAVIAQEINVGIVCLSVAEPQLLTFHAAMSQSHVCHVNLWKGRANDSGTQPLHFSQAFLISCCEPSLVGNNHRRITHAVGQREASVLHRHSPIEHIAGEYIEIRTLWQLWQTLGTNLHGDIVAQIDAEIHHGTTLPEQERRTSLIVPERTAVAPTSVHAVQAIVPTTACVDDRFSRHEGRSRLIG